MKKKNIPQKFSLVRLIGLLFCVFTLPGFAGQSLDSMRIFDQIFADRFDSCSLQEWSSAINLTDANVGQQGQNNRRYSGQCGLRVPIDSSTVRAIVDGSLNNESSVIVRFYANFDDYDNQELLLLEANRFQVRYNYPTANDITLVVRSFDTPWNFLTFENIGMGWHSIEVVWEAATSATILFSVNGLSDRSLVTNTVPSLTINQISIGNMNPAVAGSGLIHIDAYDARRISRPGRLLVGDANDDGAIDQSDVDAVMDEINGIAFAAGQPDCNEDGVVNMLDVSCIEAFFDSGEAPSATTNPASSIG